MIETTILQKSQDELTALIEQAVDNLQSKEGKPSEYTDLVMAQVFKHPLVSGNYAKIMANDIEMALISLKMPKLVDAIRVLMLFMYEVGRLQGRSEIVKIDNLQ